MKVRLPELPKLARRGGLLGALLPGCLIFGASQRRGGKREKSAPWGGRGSSVACSPGAGCRGSGCRPCSLRTLSPRHGPHETCVRNLPEYLLRFTFASSCLSFPRVSSGGGDRCRPSHLPGCLNFRRNDGFENISNSALNARGERPCFHCSLNSLFKVGSCLTSYCGSQATWTEQAVELTQMESCVFPSSFQVWDRTASHFSGPLRIQDQAFLRRRAGKRVGLFQGLCCRIR